jgi:hypothetical protein
MFDPALSSPGQKNPVASWCPWCLGGLSERAGHNGGVEPVATAPTIAACVDAAGALADNRSGRQPAMFCPNRECPDFISTGKPGEYREGITVCPYCQAELVPEDPSRSARVGGARPQARPSQSWDAGEPAAADDAQGELEPVYETSDPSEVPVVRSFLDAQGIPHVVVGEETFDAFRGSLSPFRFNPRAGVVAFLVAKEYAEIARELLVEFEGEPEDSP